MRILIVEDNEISAGILDSNLRQRNFGTVIARTGTEALQVLETHWDIGLVIADIMLPEVDGLELVRRMRADTRLQEIPVIVCSSLADAEHVAQAARLGCRHYLLKPVGRVQLLGLVDKILAEVKPAQVLGDRKQIAAKYGLPSESLGRILSAFTQLVAEGIAALTQAPAGTSGEANGVNYARLAEGAATLGAERLLVSVQALQGRGAGASITPEEHDLLLKELRLVDRALTAQTQADPPPAGNEKKPEAKAAISPLPAPPAKGPQEETAAAAPAS